VLSAERAALNLLGHLSGIATATADFVRLIKGTKTRFCCTRKTTPGLRALEKYAVRCGGGFNHRFGLDDAMLIKDNHIAVAGGVRAVLERARQNAGHLVKIEIEVDTLDQLAEVLDSGLAEVVLLDNMSLADMRKAVAMANGRVVAGSLRRHHARHHRGGGGDRRRLRILGLDHPFGAQKLRAPLSCV
jgi:nicotinate-nucleotide pyrophosphorylase (carboxylating)